MDAGVQANAHQSARKVRLPRHQRPTRRRPPLYHRVRYITKALGDYTSWLRRELQVGTPVAVEGPYGCFGFEDGRPRQVWVGACIGITPFVARMKQLARDGNAPAVTVDLFHPAAIYEDAAIETLKAHASAAAVRLHLIVDARDGRLDGKRIREAFPEWREASVWLCGPPGFGESLRKDFVAQGLPRDRFHRKLFEMRGPRRLLPASVLTGSWRRGYDSLDSRPPWPSMSG